MKKLSLNIKRFTGAEVLSRRQLKSIMGGNFGGSLPGQCVNECDNVGEPCSIGPYHGICMEYVAPEGCSPDGIEKLCVPE